MIIYKIEKDGRAGNFTYQVDSISLKSGWQSIPGDRIPEDISQYHTQEYKDYLVQIQINEDSRKYLAENDWKITRQIRHEKLVELGVLEQPALTDQEYKDLLIECQRQADLVTEG